MTAIKDRLELDNKIYNPTDSSMSLLTAQNHYDKVNNWKNRLDDKLKVLDVIFDTDCTFSQACDAWHDFFQHDFSRNSDAAYSYTCVNPDELTPVKQESNGFSKRKTLFKK